MLAKSKVSSAPSSERSSASCSRAQPLVAQPVEVDPLLPVDGVRPVRANRHGDHLACARRLRAREASPGVAGRQVLLNSLDGRWCSPALTRGRSMPADLPVARPAHPRTSGCAAASACARWPARSGVSASMISQIETAKSRPSVSTLYAITSALGMSIEDVFAPVRATRPAPPVPAAAGTRTRRSASAPARPAGAPRRAAGAEAGLRGDLGAARRAARPDGRLPAGHVRARRRPRPAAAS